jgi:serine/threonine-protein kinase
VLAGYRLEARIGAGGMAVVFRAVDQRLGRTVALKVLAPGLAGDGEFRERFVRESRAAATVDHPHIIPVYGAGEADGILFLAMRYVPGGDLRSVLHREGPLPPERAAFLLSPVASALDAAHGAGLVHRDVKPANILVDRSPGRPDHPYLSDFGLAKGAVGGAGSASEAGLTGTGQFLGTADYAAPEQISGGRSPVQTDQYALACVAFTMLTGELPFARDAPMAVLWAHLSAPPPSVTARRPDLSPAVDHVLGRGLAKDPAARYPSCGAFADALRAALGASPYSVPVPGVPVPSVPGGPVPGVPAPAPVPAVSTPPSRSGARRSRRRPASVDRRGVLAAGVAVVLVVAAVAAILLYPRPERPSQASDAPTVSPAATRASSPSATAPATGSAAGTAVKGTPARFTIPGPVPAVAVSFRTDGSLITVGTNGTEYVWDVAARQQTSAIPAPRGHVFQRAALSFDGGTAAVQDSSGVAYVLRSAGLVSTALPAGDRVYPGSIAVAGLTMVTGDRARTGVDLWVGEGATPAATMTNPDHGALLTSAALSVDATIVAASDASGRTYLWDAKTAAPAHVLRPPDGSVADCSVFSFGGGVLAPRGVLVTGNRDGRAYLWDETTGALIRSVHDPDGAVDVVAISAVVHLLATAGAGRAVHLWDAATGTPLGTVSDPGGAGVRSLAINVMGTQLAVADKNGTTYVWNLPS